MLARIVDELARREGPRILAGLIGRLGGDFDLAEEAMQEAFARALETWPATGIPERPGAWITTVARRSAIDRLRRSRRHAADSAAILEELAAPADEAPDDTGLPDDRLRLLFACCHPALAAPAQMALALRTLCGLSTREIAHAFLEPEATTAQRIVRAKHKIQEARIPYAVPLPEDLPDRLAAVLATIYLVFNEGYSATHSANLTRADFCAEAIRLAGLVPELMPGNAEALGLLAMLLLQDSRRDARTSTEGELVPLEEQDRARWNASRIAEGIAVLDRALAMRDPGPYQVAAAAVAMVAGPEKGLEWIADIEARKELGAYHLLPAARADLLRRAGRGAEARVQYGRAIALATNAAERRYLERRLRGGGARIARLAVAQMQTPDLVGSGVWLCSTLAMTYFLTGNPQYHRRGVVSRTCSGWEGVGPTRYGRQEFCRVVESRLRLNVS